MKLKIYFFSSLNITTFGCAEKAKETTRQNVTLTELA